MAVRHIRLYTDLFDRKIKKSDVSDTMEMIESELFTLK